LKCHAALAQHNRQSNPPPPTREQSAHGLRPAAYFGNHQLQILTLRSGADAIRFPLKLGIRHYSSGFARLLATRTNTFGNSPLKFSSHGLSLKKTSRHHNTILPSPLRRFNTTSLIKLSHPHALLIAYSFRQGIVSNREYFT